MSGLNNPNYKFVQQFGSRLSEFVLKACSAYTDTST